MSIAIEPGSSAAIAPPSPSSTSSTCGGAGSIVISTSTPRAQSATDPAVPAPASRKRDSATGSTSNALTSKPARDQVAAHRAAHVAEADEADARHRTPTASAA